MNKGKVIKVVKNYATLITISGEFVNIKNKGTMYVGQNVIFTEYDFYNNKSKTIAFKTIAAVIILVLVLNIYMKSMNNNTVFAVVSIDINPSVELKIDEELKVIDIETLNEDGDEILDESFIGMELSYVVNNLVQNAKQKKYLNENGSILIATAILNQKTISVDEISNIIYEKVFEENKKINVYMVSGTKEDYEQANKKDISLGKYKVIQISEIDMGIAQMKNQSVNQLKKNSMLNKKGIVNKREEIEKLKQDKKVREEPQKDIKNNRKEEKISIDKKSVGIINNKSEKNDINENEHKGNKNNKETVENEQALKNDNKEIVENKKEVNKENKETVENKKEVNKENKETVKNKKEVNKENKETVKNKKEVNKDNKETVENKKEVNKENKETVKNKKEVNNDNKEIVENKKEVNKDNKETVKNKKEVNKDSKEIVENKNEIINNKVQKNSENNNEEKNNKNSNNKKHQ